MRFSKQHPGVSKLAAISAVSILSFAACSGTAATPSTGGGSVAPSAAEVPASAAAPSVAASSASGGVPDSVNALVTQYMGQPTFTAPGPPINVSSLKGKSMFLIPLVPNPFNQSIQDTMKSIAQKVGMNFTLYPNQGQASQWVQGMNAAITAKPDIIVLNTAPDPRVLQPQLAAAKAAGIPVLVTHFYDDSSPNPPACDGCAAGVTALVTAPFNLAGSVAASWIIKDSGGNANVLLIGAGDILPSPGTVDTMKQTFAKDCPGCKVSVILIPVADWNTKVPSQVTSALTADPSINYVYPLYDAMVAGAVTAVQTIGKAGSVKVASYNGSAYVLKDIQDHNVAAMDVGEDTVGIGYANMDQAFRILLGQPIVPERTPIRVWDSTNVNEAGVPPTVGTGYGDALSNGFLALWGLK